MQDFLTITYLIDGVKKYTKSKAYLSFVTLIRNYYYFDKTLYIE